MGIFSASHRSLAKEAFECVFRKVTLRKCESDFDQKMKTRISVGLLKWNKTVGRLVFRHFEAISWVLVLLTVVSLVLVFVGIYNFVLFGNCNGPAGGFCIYNGLLGGTNKTPESLKLPTDFNTGILLGKPNASLTIVEFGCFSCPFIRTGCNALLSGATVRLASANRYWQSQLQKFMGSIIAWHQVSFIIAPLAENHHAHRLLPTRE